MASASLSVLCTNQELGLVYYIARGCCLQTLWRALFCCAPFLLRLHPTKRLLIHTAWVHEWVHYIAKAMEMTMFARPRLHPGTLAPTVRALWATNGTQAWQYMPGTTPSTHLRCGSLTVFLANSGTGVLAALHAASGALLWEYSFGAGAGPPPLPVINEAAAPGGRQ
jgi:hypothetical protein